MAYPLDSHTEAINTAKQVLKSDPIFLDTETTGLGQKDEIIEIAAVDVKGNTLIDVFVRPSGLIPADAMNIHHITDEMVLHAQRWIILWPGQLRQLLNNRVIVAYNSDFDKRMIEQTNLRYQIKMRENLRYFDLLNLFSKFRGEPGGPGQLYRKFSLDEAGKLAGISLPNSHRAVADILLARELLFYIAGENPNNSQEK